MSVPNITIFVRHSAGCKYEADEFSRRCNCRKSVRWFKDKKLHKVSAKTRSWTRAEEFKRNLEDQFEGKKPETVAGKAISDAVAVFVKEKKTVGMTDDTVNKYNRLLQRFTVFCEKQNVYTVQGITRDLITEFCAKWPEWYPSTMTRAKLREKLRSFLGYCYQSQWLPRVLEVTPVKIVEPETQPLTSEEYKRLLDVVYVTVGDGDPRRRSTQSGRGRWQTSTEAAMCQHKVYTFIQTMRWTGLAIGDAMRLRRDALKYDEEKDLYRVTTKRKKTGVPVSNPVPTDVAEDLLKIENASPVYFFWSHGKVQSATSNWGQRYIAPCFKAAGIESEGNMLSHRLRDTFAVDLLEKGVPMEEVSKLLGQTSIRTTEKHYAKWSKGRQDRLDTLVSGTWETPKKPMRRGPKPKVVAIA
jgi:site-specific recombinase XerD